jgi:hypothetical protein
MLEPTYCHIPELKFKESVWASKRVEKRHNAAITMSKLLLMSVGFLDIGILVFGVLHSDCLRFKRDELRVCSKA